MKIKKTHLLLIILAVGLVVAFILRQISVQSSLINDAQYQKLLSSMKKIESLDFFQAGDGVGVRITTKGISEDEYFLVVFVRAAGFAQGILFQLERDVMLQKQEEQFEYIVTFEDLQKAYHGLLAGYVPNLSDGLDIDEMLFVEANLLMKTSMTVDLSKFQGREVPMSKKGAFLRFTFKCDEAACQIEQFK